jgi:hypothetical protein
MVVVGVKKERDRKLFREKKKNYNAQRERGRERGRERDSLI